MPPSLPIATSLRTAVFREFCRLVTTDPEMRRIGITFRRWDGDRDSSRSPASAQLPWMRFSPEGGPQQRWSASDELSIPFSIRVEIAIDGYDVEQGMDLWEAFETLVISPDFQSAMSDAGASLVTPAVAAFGPMGRSQRGPIAEGSMYASGSILIDLMRDVLPE